MPTSSDAICTEQPQLIKIECVLALQDVQSVIVLKCLPDTSVQDAIQQIRQRHPEIFNIIQSLLIHHDAKIGVFSQIVSLDYPLKKGDRIEIYRPLTVDPKLARLRRSQVRNTRKC